VTKVTSPEVPNPLIPVADRLNHAGGRVRDRYSRQNAWILDI